jgi:cbb3-type cytochrome oxidase subunit 1
MGIKCLKIAVVYFLIGIGFGMYMSITHDFAYGSSHAHINLLGWASLALAGIIYHLFPSLSTNTLGKIHFWLHNIGLPIMMIALVMAEAGNSGTTTYIATGASILSLGILNFVVNVLGLKNSSTN